MDVKGSSVISTREFVKEKFGEDGLKKWMEAMPEESRKIYGAAIISTSWYPLKYGLTEPTKKICGLFYGGDMRGAWEAGRHSADKGLKGIYRFFVSVASPQFIIKKASTILPTYYKPSRMSAAETGPNEARVEILEFSEISGEVEHRAGGWMEKALEICGCRNVKVETVRSLLTGGDRTQFVIKWEK